MVHQILQRFGFLFSSPQPTPLSTSHSLSAPPSDESVEPSGPYLELVGCLMVLRYLCITSGMGLVLGGRGPVVLTGHVDASWVDDSAKQRSSQSYTFSLGATLAHLPADLGAKTSFASSSFYHPTSRCVLPSQDVMFNESVLFYRLFPYRSAPLPPPPLFLAPGPPPVDPLPPQGPAPSGVSQVDPLPSTMPVEVAVDSGAASGGAEPARVEPGGAEPAGAEPGGAESEGAGSGGAELGGAELGGAEPGGTEPAGAKPGGAEPEGAEPRGAESEGAESGGPEPRGTASSGGPAGTGAGGAGATSLGGAGVPARAEAAGGGGPGGAGAGSTDAGGARAGGTGVVDPGARGTGATGAGGVKGNGARGAKAGDPSTGDAGVVDPEAGLVGLGGAASGGTGAGGTVQRRPIFVLSPPESVLHQALSLPTWFQLCFLVELRWLTYLLTDLGEQPRSPPTLYVDNKAMIALCQEHILENRTKHIALRYFLARELQQRGQLRLAYVATRANTADIFTKALLSAPAAPASRRPCCPIPSRCPCSPVPSPLPSRHPCCPIPSRRPCCPVAPAVPSPLLSRPVAPAVVSPLLSRLVLSPLLSHRPCCPVSSPLSSRRPCSPVPSRRPCCPVPSPLSSLRPCCPVPSRRPCCPVASPPAVQSRPMVPAVPLRRPPSVPPRRAIRPVPSRPRRTSRPVPLHAPVRPARPSHPRCALPVCRAPCALPVRRAPCALPVRACRACPCQTRPSTIHLYASAMATPRVLRFDAEGSPLEFSVWLLRARRLLESQVQAHETLWAHASGDLPEPADPAPLAGDSTPADSDRYARERADVTAWKSRDTAAYIALSSFHPESEETHFTQVRTTSEFLTAIKARYATPTTVSLGRLFLPFLFPNLASFERTADLITHLCSLDSSYRAACTDAQLALLPPPMAITIYFIATSLPDHLASVRDALLLKHPGEPTIKVLESALKDVESNLRSVASASGVVPPPLFHGCTVPQLPTFTASLATAATNVTADAVTTSSRSRGKSGRRGGQGAGGGGGGDVVSGGGGSAGAGGAPRAAAGDSPVAAGGGDTRQPLPSQQPQQQQQVSGQGSGQRQLQRGVVHPPCTYHVLTGARRSQPCGRSHPPGQCVAQLTDMARLAYGIDGPASDWLHLVQTYGLALWGMSASQLVDLFETPHAMYDVIDSSASDSVYSTVVSLGASLAKVHDANTSPGAALEDASLSFTLDSRASHCFFRDRTTLTSLPTPVSVALADPTSGPVTARYTTTLPCLAVPSGSLTGFHVPSFLRNLVGVRSLMSQHVGVWIEPSGKTAVPASHQVAASPQVVVSGQVLVSGPVAASCSCRSLAHPTVLWHHRIGHPSISRLRATSSQRLVLGLPRVLPSLPPSLAPPCGLCVEGRLRATPHSSLRPTTEPFDTLHLDVWGPASRPGPEREIFFLVVVDNYSHYTTVFPLAKKFDVTSTLIRWLLTIADTRGHRVSCLHSDRGGEFLFGILAGFCREQGIRKSWTLPKSPQQNGISDRRISLVMEIARTSMTHARAPHFMWSYAVRYAAHQLNLWPRVSRPEVSPTSLWTGSSGVASHFRVWGCLVLVRNTSADKISHRAVFCVFLGFLEDSSDYTFYHPPLHRFFDSRDIRFDESVPYYVWYPCQGPPVPPAPLFLTSAPPPAPPVQPPPPGPAPSGVSHATPPPSVAPQVQPPSPQSSSQPTADPAGAGFCGEDLGGASSRGAGVGAESVPVQGPGSGGAGVGAEPMTAGDSSLRGVGVSGVVLGGATTGGAPSAGPGELGTDPVTSGGVGSVGGATGSLESGPGATTAPDTTPPHPYPTRHQARHQQQQQQHPEQEQEQQQPQQQQPPPPPISGLRTLGLPSPSPPSPPSRPISGPLLPPRDPSPAVFPPPLPPLSPPLSHTWPLLRSPHAHPSSHVPFSDLRTALFRSSPPRLSPCVLPSPPESALTASLSTPVTDYYRTYLTEFASTPCLDYATSLVAAPPTSPLAVGDPDALDIPTPRTYAEAVSRPWASQWRAAMDSEMASYRSTGTYVDEVPPPGVNVVDGMWIFRLKQPPGSPPVFKARYVARGFSQHEGVDFFQTFAPTPKMTTLQVLLHVAAQRDYELHSLDFSTAFLQGSLHEEVWRPVYGLRQAPREWHDTLRSTLSDLGLQPSYADPSMFVRRGSTPFFVLVYVNDLVFATADRVALAGVKLELQKRHTCTELGELRHYLGLQITRDRAACTITLSQSHMVQHALQRFELQHSSVQRTPLAIDHRLTGPFPDEPFEPSGPYAELVGCLMYLMTCTRPDLAFPLNILARFVAPGRHRPVHWTAVVRVAEYLAMTSGVGLVLGGRQDVVLTGQCDSSCADDAETHRSTQGYFFSLGSGTVSWRSTRSSSVSTSTAEAEIYAGAMAAQELRWLTFLLTGLSERPSSAPTLFTDNKATILICREPRLESRVKHINVRYFLLQELRRRGEARFDFVESEANTADIFTKALPPCTTRGVVCS
ncbi:unnamed protein product [Closterium sp. NIES-54]